MAACAGIDCRGGGNYSLSPGGSHRRMMNAAPPSAVSFSGRRNCCCSAVGRISMSMAEMVAPKPVKLERARIGDGEKRGNSGAVVSRETLDEWMRDSVVEIVKNLREAPLLVHVYGGNSGTLRATTEKAEDWKTVKGRWEEKEAQLPEGVIFVEQLKDDDVIKRESVQDHGGDDFSGGGSRAWGIVAQGRGVDCGPVCYLLKTSRVGSGIGSGSGPFCTHFCLVRVKSFRETTKSQLQNCWLLQNGQ